MKIFIKIKKVQTGDFYSLPFVLFYTSRFIMLKGSCNFEERLLLFYFLKIMF